MEYRKGNGETTSSRAIDPYGLVLWKGQWYTVAYCHERQEIRSFRVDRIIELHRTEAVFARPADFSARDFLLKSLLPARNTEEKLITVVIATDEGVLNDLCSHWLFGHTLVQRIEGQARFQVDVTSLLTYVPYFLLPYGTTLRIMEPLALKQKLSSIATDLAAHYRT